MNAAPKNNEYLVLKTNTRETASYSIVPLRREDIFLIKEWRNEQIDVLRQIAPLSDEQQINYYENSVVPSFIERHPRIVLFSYLHQGKCIGYGGLTNIDWTSKRMELSFLLDPQHAKNRELYDQDFTCFLLMAKDVTFNDLAFNRIFTETFAFRKEHIAILERNGFRLEGIMRQHVMIRGRYCDSLIHGLLREEYLHAS
jgi:RimJ/RimL family protein N-acetyltransferase